MSNGLLWWLSGNEPACQRDKDSILGLRRSPGEGMINHSSILDWEIPWIEEPAGPGFHKSQTQLSN